LLPQEFERVFYSASQGLTAAPSLYLENTSLVVLFTVDGVRAGHYDVSCGDDLQSFYYFQPQLLVRGVKICMMPFWMVGYRFRAKFRSCQITISGVFLVSGTFRA